MTALSAAPPRAVPVPLPPDAPYSPPRASISPDRSKGWLRRALPLVLSHRTLFAAALGTAFLSLVLSLRLPKVLDNAVDEALVAREAPLSRFVLEAALLAVGTGITSLLARQLLMRVAYALEYDLRNLVYEHLNRLSPAFYDRQQSGQLISRANSDVRAVQLFLAFAPFVIVQCLGAVLAFGFMVSIDPVLAVATMATLPLVAWTATLMQRALLPASWLIQSRLAEVTTIVDESVNGVRVVKSFAAEDREVRAMTRAAHRLQWAYVKDADLRARYAPVVQNVSQLGMVVLLLLGGYRVVSGDLEVGAMLAFSAYVALLQGPFQMLGNLVMMSQRAAASASRVYELLDEQPDVLDRTGAHELVVRDGEVRFEDVTFSYQPGRPVLQGFSLTLTRGETVALVGRTGSGKSTVGRLLTRAYDVDSGRITIDGDDIRDVTQSSLRSTVGVVQEEPFLFSCSIRDNIAYGRPDASPQQVEAAAEAARAAEFVSRLPEGYDTLVGERGYTLSGGQRQRIALARALLADPPVLVLDDATSSLDVEVEAQVHQALTATLPDRTVLVVAHRLSTISTADRVVLLEGGRIVADGAHADLLETSPVYKEVLAQVHAHEPLDDAPPIDLEPVLTVDLEMGLRP
jgi:ATP-binding cassette, subfamily B, bacterial